MAMSNAERQERWLEKNRALHNFRRRKKNLGGGVESRHAVTADDVASPNGCGIPVSRESGKATSESSASSAQSHPELVATAGKFPRMIGLSPAAAPIKEEAPPTIYRNDRGAVITKCEWDRQQAEKQKAEKYNYVVGDEYTQL